MEITNIVLLVHPFYSFFRERDLPVMNWKPIDLRLGKKNMQRLMGWWGAELKKTAENPHSIVLFVAYHPQTDHRSHVVPLQLEKRFTQYARRILGDRLFVVDTAIPSSGINAREFLTKIRARGFEINRKKVEGIAFGEMLQDCAHSQRKSLVRILKIRDSKIKPVPSLSLEGYRSTHLRSAGTIRKLNRRRR